MRTNFFKVVLILIASFFMTQTASAGQLRTTDRADRVSSKQLDRKIKRSSTSRSKSNLREKRSRTSRKGFGTRSRISARSNEECEINGITFTIDEGETCDDYHACGQFVTNAEFTECSAHCPGVGFVDLEPNEPCPEPEGKPEETDNSDEADKFAAEVAAAEWCAANHSPEDLANCFIQLTTPGAGGDTPQEECGLAGTLGCSNEDHWLQWCLENNSDNDECHSQLEDGTWNENNTQDADNEASEDDEEMAEDKNDASDETTTDEAADDEAADNETTDDNDGTSESGDDEMTTEGEGMTEGEEEMTENVSGNSRKKRTARFTRGSKPTSRFSSRRQSRK